MYYRITLSRISHRTVWIRALQIAVIVALVYFIGDRVADNWTQIREYDWKIKPIPLIASLAVMNLALFLMSAVLRDIFALFSRHIPNRKAYKIAYLSQLGRYIPGKVWQVFGMVYLAGKEGISKAEALTSFAMAQIFTTPPAVLIVWIYVMFGDTPGLEDMNLTWLYVVIGAVCVVSFAVAFRPQWVSSLVNLLLTRLGRETIRIEPGKKGGSRILFIYLVGWVTYGLAFYLFLISVSDFPADRIIEAAGAFCAAYLIGYWSILTPGGIGVREAIMVLLLAPFFPPGVAAAVAAFARLWSIVGELIASTIALKIR